MEEKSFQAEAPHPWSNASSIKVCERNPVARRTLRAFWHRFELMPRCTHVDG